MTLPASVAGRYQVILRGTNGAKLATFDQFELEYGKYLNDVDYHVLTLPNGNDARCQLFELDCLVDVRRSVPGCGLDWYTDYRGFHIDPIYDYRNSRFIFQSRGNGLNDLLARTRIMYKGGTIKAEKYDAAETVMKEYVEENCGPSATTANGREYNGVLSGFTVEGSNGNGDLWGGSREFESLLDVVKQIGLQANIDFAVMANDDSITGEPGFIFRTFVDHLGEDRTTIGLDPSTGKNASGNDPVIFSVSNANVQDMTYSISYTPEVNVVAVLGKGDKSTKTVVVLANNIEVEKSPWNRRESAIQASNQTYTYQLISAGAEALAAGQAKEQFTFSPLQQEACLYGKDYNIGDYVTAIVIGTGEIRHKRIMSVKVNISAGKETFYIEFADVL